MVATEIFGLTESDASDVRILGQAQRSAHRESMQVPLLHCRGCGGGSASFHAETSHGCRNLVWMLDRPHFSMCSNHMFAALFIIFRLSVIQHCNNEDPSRSMTGCVLMAAGSYPRDLTSHRVPRLRIDLTMWLHRPLLTRPESLG